MIEARAHANLVTMNNLMPEKRMDKTGKLVTRHVRMDSKSAAPSNLPAPSLGSPARKPAKKPLAKQLKPQMYWLDTGEFDFSYDLYRALGSVQPSVILDANELEIYDVLSVASTDNAVALLASGIKTADDAKSFLHEKGLDKLIIDRKDMTDEAVDRRINSYTFISMKKKYKSVSLDGDPKNFLDAARLSDSWSLGTFNNILTKEETSFPEEVLKGTINYDDVMGLGLTLLKDNKYYAPSIFECLAAMKRGEVKRDTEALKDLLENRVRGSYTLLDSLKLVTELGKEFTSTIQFMDQAHSVYRAYPDLPVSDRKSLISYADKGTTLFSKIRVDEIAKLHDGGVPVEKAGEMLAAGMTVDQIVGAYQNEVNPAVSTGWL